METVWKNKSTKNEYVQNVVRKKWERRFIWKDQSYLVDERDFMPSNLHSYIYLQQITF